MGLIGVCGCLFGVFGGAVGGLGGYGGSCGVWGISGLFEDHSEAGRGIWGLTLGQDGFKGFLWGQMSGSYGAAVGHLWGTYRSLILPHQLAELWASFRGRRLGGRERPLPHGYQGGILQRSPPSSLDSDLQVTLPHGCATVTYICVIPPPPNMDPHSCPIATHTFLFSPPSLLLSPPPLPPRR